MEEIEELVRPCGLFRSKASSIKASSQKLIGEYGGVIPRDIDRLLEFPGVGRKIANLVLGDVYGLGGIVADTHFMRICGRAHFYGEELRDAVRVERIMDPLVPRERQSELCHRAAAVGATFVRRARRDAANVRLQRYARICRARVSERRRDKVPSADEAAFGREIWVLPVWKHERAFSGEV